MKRSTLPAIALQGAVLLTVPLPAIAEDEILTPDRINNAVFDGQPAPDGRSALVARLQILLDRAGASPGVIDGIAGENVDKALRGFEAVNRLPEDGMLDETTWGALQAFGEQVIVGHTISADDVSGLSGPLPTDYGELARLDRIGFTSVEEKLAERFHMDIGFLKHLNPRASFTRGETIAVAAPGEPLERPVHHMVADKSAAQLRAYDAGNKLVAAYPVTIGSSSTPSPTGVHTVNGVAMDPTYSYDPENFVQGDNTEPLTLPPGPNGPVGSVWIDLSEPTYGIHGTPEPSKIDKTASHGCVRMTNWDASELAHMVKTGVTVEFRD